MPSKCDYVDRAIVIEPDALEGGLSNPNLRIIDCNLGLEPKPGGGYIVTSGQSDWERAHIPNSCYIDLDVELSSKRTDLRFMLPPARQFAEVMSLAGIGNEHDVVVYSGGSNMWATRLFLMFREFGFDRVRVLNGGWDGWTAEARPVTAEPPDWPPSHFHASRPKGIFVDKNLVLSAVDDQQTCIVNALSAESYSGTLFNPTYGRPGRIKSSVNLPAVDLIDPDTKRFLDANALRARFDLIGALDTDRVITYCGGGISATTDAFALMLLGKESVNVYDGSMMEWGHDSSLPMESDTG